MASGGNGGYLCVLSGHTPFCGCQSSSWYDQQDASGTADPIQFAEDPLKERGLSGELRRSSSGSRTSLRGGKSGDRSSPRVSMTDAADEAAGGNKRQGANADHGSREESREHSDSANRRSLLGPGATFLMSTGTFCSSDLEGPQVRLDEEFDFYEPNTRQLKIMKMADVKHDVLHQRDQKASWMKRFLRRKSVDPTTNKGGGHAADECSISSDRSGDKDASDISGELSDDLENSGEFGSPETRGSDDHSISSRDSPDKEGADSRPELFRQPSAFDGENVTNWGTLIAKLLRRRVHGIGVVAMRTIHKRRNSRVATISSSTAHAQYVLPGVRVRAQLVVDQARTLAKMVAQEAADRYDSTWEDSSTIPFLFGEDYIDTLMLLANTARKVVAAQPVVCEATAPCRVFGDIHGQLRDLLILFRAFGSPGDEAPSFVFNGDFVDRGSHSLEVIGLLFAFKIILPEKVWLVRGNHEDRSMNERYGFESECYHVLGEDFGPKTYELIHRAFDELPLACLISEKVLVVHGGIGAGNWLLNDLRAVQRPLRERQLASDPMVWNVLWSDPIEDDHGNDQSTVFGVHASPRSSAGLYKFGWNVTKTFCAANGLGMIIRSHQSKEGSLGFSVMHDKMLVRVFSARDYEEHGNDGAVVLLNLEDPNKPRGGLVVRPQVMRSYAKQNDEDPATKGKYKRTTERLKAWRRGFRG